MKLKIPKVKMLWVLLYCSAFGIEARMWHGLFPDPSEGIRVLALEEKSVGTFRSCLECWGMIRRASRHEQ